MTGSYTCWTVFLHPLSQPLLAKKRDFFYSTEGPSVFDISNLVAIRVPFLSQLRNIRKRAVSVIMQLKSSSLQTAYWGRGEGGTRRSGTYCMHTHTYTTHTYTIYTQREKRRDGPPHESSVPRSLKSPRSRPPGAPHLEGDTSAQEERITTKDLESPTRCYQTGDGYLLGNTMSQLYDNAEKNALLLIHYVLGSMYLFVFIVICRL